MTDDENFDDENFDDEDFDEQEDRPGERMTVQPPPDRDEIELTLAIRDDLVFNAVDPASIEYSDGFEVGDGFEVSDGFETARWCEAHPGQEALAFSLLMQTTVEILCAAADSENSKIMIYDDGWTNPRHPSRDGWIVDWADRERKHLEAQLRLARADLPEPVDEEGEQDE